MSDKDGLLSRLWAGISALPALVLLIVGLLAGAASLGGFNAVMELSGDMEFCISCHEMKDNVYKEYTETVHFKNQSGVQADCTACHVPKPWFHKVLAKTAAAKEIYHKILGTIDTPEKFNKHRWEMANRVWTKMKETDSRECRNCHSFDNMDLSEQGRSARNKHSKAQDEGKTCIDCHKGLAHEEPDEPEDAGEE